MLSTVLGLPALKVPAPRVGLLNSEGATAVDGACGTAVSTITGLKVTRPAITLPVAAALLPGLAVLRAGRAADGHGPRARHP